VTGPVVERAAEGGGRRRANDMLLIRESAKDEEQLLGMAHQAHAAARAVEGWQALRDAGIDPLRNPQDHDGEVWTDRANRLVLFAAAGTGRRTLEVLALASAARTQGASQWWTDVLEEILRAERPRRLWLPSASRLTRDLLAGNRLLRVIEECVDTVMLGGAAIDIGPQNPHGGMSLSFAVAFAAAERDEIVRRNVQGRIAHVGDRGRWLGGWPSVPLGYALGHDGTLAPDPAAGQVLELVARLLADPAYDPQDALAVLGGVGLATPRGSGQRRWVWDVDAVAVELAAVRDRQEGVL